MPNMKQELQPELSPSGIKRIRTKVLGLSQAKFAVLVGVKVLAISRWENSVACPGLPTQRLILALEKVGTRKVKK